jgi:hypothetical protein
VFAELPIWAKNGFDEVKVDWVCIALAYGLLKDDCEPCGPWKKGLEVTFMAGGEATNPYCCGIRGTGGVMDCCNRAPNCGWD